MSHAAGTRRRKLLRALFLVVVAGVVSQLVSKRMTSGDEDSDAFQLAAVFGGREFKSRATALRSASALAVMGGVEIDLREATLDPAGATLDITTVMGGVEVTLPPGWVVDLETHEHMGGVDSRLTDSADTAEGAPTLHVKANAWLGGVEIRQ
ncbi:MAG TPA: LiaF domain-containing protein [Nocardioidaceae bacterium]|jgi:predicted membrane protein